MQPITRVATTSHFLLMFGYKLFSFFFPLYLVQQGLSLPEVGYTYLLIYLPLALASPVAGYVGYRIRPGLLATAGILGYGAYALAMWAAPAPPVFYFMQVVLGVSAALFFASMRALIFAKKERSPDAAFGIFYSAPRYAEVVAPAVGAAIIWALGFPAVFILSAAVQLGNAAYAFTQLSHTRPPAKKPAGLPQVLEKYRELAQGLRRPDVAPLFIIACLVLLMEGIYFPYQILFLENLGWTRNMILGYGAALNALFIPMSFFLVRWIRKHTSRQNIVAGASLSAAGSIAFGALAARLPAPGVVATLLLRGAGGLIGSAGRSGLLSRRFTGISQELGSFDTMLSPLGIALGALLGSFLVTRLDLSSLFIQAGVLILLVIGLFKLLHQGRI